MSSSSSPRILQMMLSTQEGGAENFFEKLSLAFDQRGLTQKLIVEPLPRRVDHLATCRHAEVTPLSFRGLNRPFAGGQLRRAIESFRPDVILTWMNRASRRVPAGLPCPVVGRLGGYYDLKYYENCSYLVGITPDLVEHIKGGGWPADACSLIPNFGEAPGSSDRAAAESQRQSIREAIGVDEATPLVLALGRLHEVKAHDTLLKAIARVPGCALMIAGTGPLKDELEALTRQLGLSERVHFLGWRRDVENLFAASDLCVFPSRYEPNGTVVMESWAHRVPLIASLAKGPAWLVTDDHDGLLFPIDDIDALTGCLQRVTADPDLRARLAENGYRTFRERYTREIIVDSYLDLFHRLTQASPTL